jgi:hypothetical protein
MAVPVARDFVASIGNFANEIRMMFCNPSEYEKRGGHAGVVEHIQYTMRVGNDS